MASSTTNIYNEALPITLGDPTILDHCPVCGKPYGKGDEDTEPGRTCECAKFN